MRIERAEPDGLALFADWTLAVRQEGASGFLGKLRTSIPVATLGWGPSTVRVADSRKTQAPDGSGRDTWYCDVLDLSRTNEPNTPGSRWNWYFPDDMVSFIVLDGSVTAASYCVAGGPSPL